MKWDVGKLMHGWNWKDNSKYKSMYRFIHGQEVAFTSLITKGGGSIPSFTVYHPC